MAVERGFVDRMLAKMISGRGSSDLPVRLRRTAPKPLWTRLRMMLCRVFPPPAAMPAIYHLPDGSPLVALYYPWRPLDLLLRYGRQAWRLLRGDAAAREAWHQERELEVWLGVDRAW